MPFLLSREFIQRSISKLLNKRKDISLTESAESGNEMPFGLKVFPWHRLHGRTLTLEVVFSTDNGFNYLFVYGRDASTDELYVIHYERTSIKG